MSQTPNPSQPTASQVLPQLMQSMLKVRVPVSVTLATKKQPIARIMEIGPGAILQFSKSCEELLDLCVGDRSIGKGEPVKVGDKFGLRLVSITPPEERFATVGKASATAS